MLGARSIGSLALLVVSLHIASSRDLLTVTYLAGLDVQTAFLIGVFATTATAMGSSILRLHRGSAHYFRVAMKRVSGREILLLGAWSRGLVVGARSNEKVRDLPVLIQQPVYIAVLALVGLVCFDNRSTVLLMSAGDTFRPGQSQFCKQPDTEPAKPEPPAMQGCALVIRAYKLGYAKSLGSCAAKAERAEQTVCASRRRGEPNLHYSWRLLKRRLGTVSTAAVSKGAIGSWRRFRANVDQLDTLLTRQMRLVVGSPRASHHLWTNLPKQKRSLIQRLKSGTCTRRYSAIRPGLTQTASPSAALDRALGRLLFNQRYRPMTGQCRELTIHWGAASDACQRLADKPEKFLASSGALDSVRTVLDRYEHRDQPSAETPQRIVSFQCLMVDERGDGRRTHTQVSVSVDGHTFVASEIRAADLGASARGQVAMHRSLAELLSPGFRYTALLSGASSMQAAGSAVTPKLVRGDDYALAKLELLRGADVFLGHAWVLERLDLVEVYPFHLHLDNFVEVFRRHYVKQRGRL